MKIYFSSFIILAFITLFSYSQNKLGEVTVDNEGNVIHETKTTSNTDIHETSEEVLDRVLF